jgi:hypothetical protein
MTEEEQRAVAHETAKIVAERDRALQSLKNILEISYAGHPDGRLDRLKMIERHAAHGLGKS